MTAAAAGLTTLLDAALLQRKWNYFSGGFLAVDHIETGTQALVFLIGSLLADASVLSVAITIVLWLAVALRLTPRYAVTVTMVASIVPVIAVDFINYQLMSFLGESFDLQLMFDLSGRNIWESVAVSSAHLSTLGWAAALASPVLMWAIWVAVGKVSDKIWSKTIGFVNPQGRKTLIAGTVLLVVAGTFLVYARSSSDAVDNGLKRKPTVAAISLAISWLSDVDGDGAGILGRFPDTAPFDGTIHPFALDIPGNGIDEDGVGGDLPTAPDLFPEPDSPAVWVRRPNVVFIMLESVRADAVGSQVNGRPVTPVLDALSRSGIAATSAFSHNGFTVQSRLHTFSGSLLGAVGSTLIDDFKANGYEVAYFSAQDESFGSEEGDIGVSRADVFYDARQDVRRRFSRAVTPGSLAVPYDVVLERIEHFLSRRSPEKPLFLYVNFQDTHFPYHHPGIRSILDTPIVAQGAIAPIRANSVRRMYANTLANVDRAVGLLVENATVNLGAPPAVVVLSDHGESLCDEDALGHGYVLNDAQTRIPLIVSRLPVSLVEPLGQSEIRWLINDALSKPLNGTHGDAPRLTTQSSREVFQYLGIISGPAQIGFRSMDGRIVYDFRSGRARVASGPWLRPAELSTPDSRRFHSLVQTWERMMWARRRLAQSPKQ
jgi:hypothetical protein